MSSGTERELLEMVRAIWERRRDAVLARVSVLEEAGAAGARGTLAAELREAARGEAHKLAGSTGSFGFPEGSRIALEIESLLEDGTATTAEGARIAELAAALRQVLQGEPVIASVAS